MYKHQTVNLTARKTKTVAISRYFSFGGSFHMSEPKMGSACWSYPMLFTFSQQAGTH